MKGSDSMARPSKPVSVIKSEKVAHRTNSELKAREQAEKAMLSGDLISEFYEVKSNRKAHIEFQRVIMVLDKIEKNDKMYETIVNRYCMLLAECYELNKLRTDTSKAVKEMKKQFSERVLSEIDADKKADYALSFADKMYKLSGLLLKYDSEIDKKRSMMLAIEKEMGMTMAAMLRTIPKKEEKKESAWSKVLGGGI